MDDPDMICQLYSSNISNQAVVSVTEYIGNIPLTDPETINLHNPPSLEVTVSTEESIICLDGDEILDELPTNETPLDLSSTNLPVIMPRVLDHSNDDDDDFSIVYEGISEPPEVQIIERKSRNSLSVIQYPRNDIHTAGPSGQNSNQLEVIDVEQTNTPADVCIVDASPKAIQLNQNEVISNLQKSLLASTEKKKRKIECGVCFDGPDEIENREERLVVTVCGHIFCSECITKCIKSIKHCPICRKKLTMKQFHILHV